MLDARRRDPGGLGLEVLSRQLARAGTDDDRDEIRRLATRLLDEVSRGIAISRGALAGLPDVLRDAVVEGRRRLAEALIELVRWPEEGEPRPSIVSVARVLAALRRQRVLEQRVIAFAQAS
ncbi:MAG: hypothetical protein M5U14_11905 [Acidimicrobiia bacterium]|nr:hypothetical protein [Acidimicrobiia bacterium]